MSEPIKRPVVRVVTLTFSSSGNQIFEAQCTHCTWIYRNIAKTDVTWHATCHRNAHRGGRA